MIDPAALAARLPAARHAITLSARFHAAHRLPQLATDDDPHPKCASVHGHHWGVHVTITAPALTGRDTVADFGTFKAAMSGWITRNLDHGAILGAADPVAADLAGRGSKVFALARDPGAAGDRFGTRTSTVADWPTVEALALLMADRAIRHWLPLTALTGEVAEGAAVTRVKVTETPDNSAEWILQ